MGRQSHNSFGNARTISSSQFVPHVSYIPSSTPTASENNGQLLPAGILGTWPALIRRLFHWKVSVYCWKHGGTPVKFVLGLPGPSPLTRPLRGRIIQVPLVLVRLRACRDATSHILPLHSSSIQIRNYIIPQREAHNPRHGNWRRKGTAKPQPMRLCVGPRSHEPGLT